MFDRVKAHIVGFFMQLLIMLSHLCWFKKYLISIILSTIIQNCMQMEKRSDFKQKLICKSSPVLFRHSQSPILYCQAGIYRAARGTQQIRGKVSPFLHPLIKIDKISTHNRATYYMQLIDCNKAWIECPHGLQLLPR